MSDNNLSANVDMIPAGHGWVIRKSYYIHGILVWRNTYITDYAEALRIWKSLCSAENEK